jgi:hypothetical protein
MTRWKREKPDTLILMHAHNRWSNLYTTLIDTAIALDIPVLCREYANHYDGSLDREWLVPAGCRDLIIRTANDALREWDTYHEVCA